MMMVIVVIMHGDSGDDYDSGNFDIGGSGDDNGDSDDSDGGVGVDRGGGEKGKLLDARISSK